MASDDWIKIRKKLPRDGRVREMSRKLRTSVQEVSGMLLDFWILADDHADENGVLIGWEMRDVNDDLRVEGFCEAMPSDWLTLENKWVKLPDYVEHNGTTAKTRAVDAKRKKRVREMSKKCPKKSGLEKRREEKNIITNSNNSAALVFPPELDTPACRQAWAEWTSYKSERRQKYASVGSENRVLASVAKHGPTRFVKAIDKAKRSNWAGFFPENEEEDRQRKPTLDVIAMFDEARAAKPKGVR